jgi:predicted CopG family antitoxin
MHMQRCMGAKTISLEDSAYMKLKAAKRPGESFSDVINRILGGGEPSLLDLRKLFDRKSVDQLVEAIARMREEDLATPKIRSSIRQ